MSDDKIRILALHGYRQNAEKFKRITRPLVEGLSMFVKFVFVTAPHEVLLVDDPDQLELGEKINNQEYSWYFNRENLTYRGIRNGGPAIGFEETIRRIESIFETYGPFDGILGYSQGACLAALLCDLQQRGLIRAKFNFAILISGLKSNCLPHLKYFGEIISLPTLHVIGDNDDIISKENGESLAEAFETPSIMRHTENHRLPRSSQHVEEYQNFIYNQYISKNVS